MANNECPYCRSLDRREYHTDGCNRPAQPAPVSRDTRPRAVSTGDAYGAGPGPGGASEDTEPARCQNCGAQFVMRSVACPICEVPAPASDDEMTPGPSDEAHDALTDAVKEFRARGGLHRYRAVEQRITDFEAAIRAQAAADFKLAHDTFGCTQWYEAREQMAAVTAENEGLKRKLFEEAWVTAEDHERVTAERDRLRDALMYVHVRTNDGPSRDRIRAALRLPSTGGGESNQEVK
jgi:hypothetical protein